MRVPSLDSVKIVAATTLAAVSYGIVHDQITARICIEYFTVTHPKLIDSTSPTLVGLAWGVVATWWVGAIAGVLLALACRVGPRPKLTARWAIPRLGGVLLITGLLAATAGVLMARTPNFNALEGIYAPQAVERIPEAQRDGWDVCFAVHNVSYLVGALGGVVLFVVAIVDRVRLSRRASGATLDALRE